MTEHDLQIPRAKRYRAMDEIIGINYVIQLSLMVLLDLNIMLKTPPNHSLVDASIFMLLGITLVAGWINIQRAIFEDWLELWRITEDGDLEFLGVDTRSVKLSEINKNEDA